ncbi:MAG TPA: EamA family transporter RarD [Chthoniobacterales bacterium]|jgi:chloramphenicol-sensitive protein RarD
MPRSHSPHERSALVAGIAAFAMWGLVPVYWKLLQSVPALEILAHRFVWTWVFIAVLLSWHGRWPELLGTIRSPRMRAFCIAGGLAIATNWFFFIWAVNSGHVLETSLGYFMTPLVNMLFGAVFLRERLNRVQLASVLLATGAVVYLTIDLGRPPWVALVLCSSFGLYGLFRKVSGAGPLAGLFLETTLILPIALGYLAFLVAKGGGHFRFTTPSLSGLLITTGIVTGVPLLWFAHAARHLRLTTLGFLQYLAPSGTFFLGVFVYDETFRRAQIVTFGLIWVALAFYSADAGARWRSGRSANLQPVEM